MQVISKVFNTKTVNDHQNNKKSTSYLMPSSKSRNKSSSVKKRFIEIEESVELT